MLGNIEKLKKLPIAGILILFTVIISYASAQTASSQTPETADSDQLTETTEKRVTKRSVPTWITLPKLPAFAEDRLDLTKNGIAYLIQEDRVQVTDKGYNYFHRLAYKITDRKGLETAAQISHSFDPELDTLSYNFIKVIRDGKTVDRLPDLNIQELQREDELSRGLIDGDITALIQLKDIRVGDVIDYGYYSEHSTPLWPGHFFHNVSLSYSVPVTVQRYEISVPDSTILNLDTINSNVRPKVSKNNGHTTYLYELRNADTDTTVSNVPRDVITGSYILVSTMQSWQDISQWGAAVYDVDMALPKAYQKKVRQLAKDNTSHEDRMVAALKLIQSDIRYLGIESGINSHKPRAPATTLSRGYGDCKDKTVLLMATLNSLGIDSSAALVSTNSGHVLAQLLPSINNFDHVIARAVIDGKSYWLDPTLTHQGGNAETLAIPNYGYVLPLKNDQTDLVKIDIPPPSIPTIHTTETYGLTEDGAMKLGVQTTFRGKNADATRQKLAKNGLEPTSKSYLNYYANLYPGLHIHHKMRVLDDDEKNEVSIIESYELSSADFEKNKLNEKIYMKATTLEGQLPNKIEADRVIKLGLNEQTFLQHTMAIETPGRQFTAPEDKITETSGIVFSKTYTSENNTLILDYSLKIIKPSVSLTHARDVTQLAKDIANDIEVNVFPKAARAKLSERIGTKTDIPKNIETTLEDVTQLIRKKENVQALEQLNTLQREYTKTDVLRGYIQLLRGAVFVDLDRSQSAITAFDEAFALYEPDKIDLYFHYAGLLSSDEQFVKSAEVMERLFIKLPESIKKVEYEWLSRLLGELYTAEELTIRDNLIVAGAQAQLKFLEDIPPAEQFVERAIPIFVKQERTKDAAPFLPHLRDPAIIRDILINKEMEPIWEDITKLAGGDLSKAITNYSDYYADLALKEDADFKTKAQYLDALGKAGEYQKAHIFAQKELENWSRVDAVGTDAYWFVNAYAYVLSSMGNTDEADALFDKLLVGRLADHPDLVGPAINQITLLTLNGNYTKALQLLETYKDAKYVYASDYGWMYMHQARACAMSETGDKTSALKIYTDNTKDIASKNLGAHFLALVCLDKTDKAAEVLIERLESKIQRDGTLPVFSTANPPKNIRPFQEKLMTKVRAIAARKDVTEVFEKYGRSIHINGPGNYWQEW